MEFEIEKSNLLAEIECSYKSKTPVINLPQILTSKSSADYFRSVWNPNKIEYVEEFYIMLLNRGNLADPKVIFQNALTGNASSIILAHNHPSGRKEPSEADKTMTSKLYRIGKLLEISVLDHIILTYDDHFSFADDGLMLA